MTAKNPQLNVTNPETKAEWLRWCSARELKFDDAKEWMELYDFTLSVEDWEQELWDFALAINDQFNDVTSYVPQKREA